ncbi:hypothetical protein QAD02_006012 [Eretmocerus hayati]|uniref:Uncharacterized protein n=1 Tax=Eretmocerus hayati TaxID=131215 RepID=A0ACC2N3U0_9HYME|nr:hypothetical protein QAD02_006012 [Eretmocerus hayati]
MGRKIPGKKHRGVKDPELQRAKRFAELAPKINAPPKDCDDQDLPKSLQRVIKLKNAAKSGAFALKKRKKKKGKKLIRLGAEQQGVKPYPKARPEKVVPIFNQEPGESTHQFWNRVNRETQSFIKETEFETKYNVNVKRSEDTGEIVGVVKKPKDELDELEKLRSKAKNIKKKKKNVSEGDSAPKSKSQKRREKLLKKKEKKHQDDVDDFKTFTDRVEFGEVAHAPPELKVLPRKADKDSPKPKNKNLLLSSILSENKPPIIEKSKTIDKSGKRKNLPVGERRQLEKQQSDVIAAYRLLKAQKLGESG